MFKQNMYAFVFHLVYYYMCLQEHPLSNQLIWLKNINVAEQIH